MSKMSKYKVEVQDENGNVYYPHSEADVIFFPDGENVEDKIKFLTNPEFDASGSVAEIKDKSTLLTSLISKMPLVKFMRNVKAGFKLALYAGEMVNDCVTNRPDLPLSAAQGKVLMDLYTKLYSDMNMRYNPDTDYIQCKYDGIWRDLEKAYMHALILYNSGNEYADITGGWSDTQLGLSYSEAYPTMTKTANFIQLQDSGKYGGAKYCTNNPIDMTNYNKIIFNISNVLTSTGQSEIGILSAKAYMPSSGIVVASSKEFGEVTTRDVEIDITNKSGNWYPFFGYVHGSTAQSSNEGKIIVHSVRLLK